MIINNISLSKNVPSHTWPFFLAPIQQLYKEGLTFIQPITFIVGENGAGKSTFIESIAEAYGLDVRGGHGGRQYAVSGPQISPLGQALELNLTRAGQMAKIKNAQGFFLRSETAKGVFEYMSDHGVPGYGDKNIAEVSHGEGYIQVLLGRFKGKGLYLLDEPEAALSFTSCLALMERLKQVTENGSQVICATHSPILTALPGAQILEFNSSGFHQSEWSELELVQHWQRYMNNPDIYLKDLDLR